MKKCLIIIISFLLLIDYEALSQTPLREKRIYLVDLTGSMEGRGVVETPNILQDVKDNLVETIGNIEDPSTEIEIVPFTNKVWESTSGAISEKEPLLEYVRNLKTLPGDTNIADAWSYGITQIDSLKINYLFLLTDGLHNSGPSKEELFSRLQEWSDFSHGKYLYAFYVMLTPNAKESKLCEIVDSTANMWLIESMDINAALIKTSISHRKNIYANPRTSIAFETNNSRVKLGDLNLSFRLQDNDLYEINNVSKSVMGDSYSFDIVEKKAKIAEPLDTMLNLNISYDKQAFPFVFMTPECIELEILNQGPRKVSVRSLKRKNPPIEEITFHKVKYKEPFRGFFRWTRRVFEPTLKIPPFKWCAPDTAISTYPVLISFNEEAVRSHSRIRFMMRDENDIALSNLVFLNNGTLEYLDAKSSPDTIELGLKVLPGIPSTKFTGSIVAYSDNIDDINDCELHSNVTEIGTWQLKYKKSWPFWLWLMWLLLLALALKYLIIIILKAVGSIKSAFNRAPSKKTTMGIRKD